VQSARDLFEEVDSDGSGAIDRAELGVLIRKLGRQWSEAQLDEAMLAIDEVPSHDACTMHNPCITYLHTIRAVFGIVFVLLYVFAECMSAWMHGCACVQDGSGLVEFCEFEEWVSDYTSKCQSNLACKSAALCWQVKAPAMTEYCSGNVTVDPRAEGRHRCPLHRRASA
jgi:hypothetical protein